MFSESYATYTAAPPIKRRVKVTCGENGGIARHWPDETVPINECPLDIALGETAEFANDGSIDMDTKDNATEKQYPDTLNPVEWSLHADGHEHTGSGSLSYTFNESGYYSAPAEIDDVGNHGADDGKCYLSASVNVLPVDYVIVLPNPNQDPNRCAPGKQIVFTGYAFNHGPDGEPYFNQYGIPIPGRTYDDIPLGATFDWSTNIGSVDPIYDSASTTFTADAGTGEGSVTATYDKCGNTKSGSAAVEVLSVDYIIVLPNPGVCAPGENITFTGHAYNHGPNGIRDLDDYGIVIGGHTNDDIHLAATYDWSLSPEELGSINPTQDSGSTTFTAYSFTGEGTIKAVYNKLGNYKEDTAEVRVEKDYGGYNAFIDLTGINYDLVQNVPLNGSMPTARDGTGSVNEMKAKVVIEAEANTEYLVILNDSKDLTFTPANFEITTDDDGKAEREVLLNGGTQTGDDNLYGYLFLDDLDDYEIARTKEVIVAYEFIVVGTKINSQGGKEGVESTYDKVAGTADAPHTGAGGTPLVHTSGAWVSHEYSVAVETEPAHAYSGSVEVDVVMEASMHYIVKMKKLDEPPFGDSISISVSYGIVSVSAGIPGGTWPIGLCGLDVALGIDGTWTQSGDIPCVSTEINVPNDQTYDIGWWSNFQPIEQCSSQLTCEVYNPIDFPFEVKVTAAAKVKVSHYDWWVYSSVDILWNRNEIQTEEINFREYDNVFEGQQC